MSETKRKFRETYPKPISGIYDAVVQELLVQQHLIRYNRKYKYNAVRGCACFLPNAELSQYMQDLSPCTQTCAHHDLHRLWQAAALGFVSVFDQVLEGLPSDEQAAVFKAYIEALDEDPQQYRSDAEAWESWVKGLSGEPARHAPRYRCFRAYAVLEEVFLLAVRGHASSRAAAS